MTLRFLHGVLVFSQNQDDAMKTRPGEGEEVVDPVTVVLLTGRCFSAQASLRNPRRTHFECTRR